jgi:hypothetical protein
MGQIGSPETTVLNQPTLRINPEDGKIQINIFITTSNNYFYYVCIRILTAPADLLEINSEFLSMFQTVTTSEQVNVN